MSSSTVKIWDASYYTDGKTLDREIKGIDVAGVHYNIQIEPGKYKEEADEAFKELLLLKSHKDNEEIKIGLDNNGHLTAANAGWVRGSNPALHYRGNGLRRHKVWFQEEDKWLFAYKYTGWQWRVVHATFKIDATSFPKTTAMVEKMKETCSQNQWIATIYENGADYIGMHSDKTETWEPESNFQVVKWGHPRLFQFRLRDGFNNKGKLDPEKGTLIFSKILPAGTSLVVDLKTNEMTSHGVPAVDDPQVGLSGSIVGRDIKERLSFEGAKKEIVKAEKSRVKRREVKRKRDEEKAKQKKKKAKKDEEESDSDDSDSDDE